MMLGGPFLVIGLLLILSALLGAQGTGRPRGTVARFILSPLNPASWQATAAILIGFVVEIVAFSLAVSFFSAGTSLLVVGVGVVILGIGVEACRLIVRIERSRATMADPRPPRPPPNRPCGSGVPDPASAGFPR